MTEIPEDVTRVADNIANERFALGVGLMSVQELSDTVAASLLAERERCARIAETTVQHISPDGQIMYGQRQKTWDEIAAAIRMGPQ